MPRSPSATESAFTCPNCRAFSHHAWYNLHAEFVQGLPGIRGDKVPDDKLVMVGSLLQKTVRRPANLFAASCQNCSFLSLWHNEKLLYPRTSFAPPANRDMPDEVMDLYNEAAAIFAVSPRAAAALLRLAVEKICHEQLGEKLRLDDAIGELVARGLPEVVQQSMDGLRVTGNEAVHEGRIAMDDTSDSAGPLFDALNLIVEKLISEPKRAAALYAQIPPEKRAAIEARNNKAVSRAKRSPDQPH